ncbi:unnamed protein product [Phytomonas sp. Hart1]|nr:unnamed protein product [Phytomonas sp. Hart1]|eukprot:CCW68322.1 unnamed protein product [Phytomonas sp. isolate Hart1]
MNRLNIKDATKEQLIDIVKQLRQDIQRLQSPARGTDGVVKKLEEQIFQLQAAVRDGNYEIDALRQHNTILTEKSANDEETISMLIKRFETVGKDGKDPRYQTDGDSFNVQHSTVLGPQDTSKRTSGSSSFLVSSQSPNEDSHANEHGAPSAAALASMAILAKKNEKIAKLEEKVLGLMEINAFYSSIVSQQGKEERIHQMGGGTHKAAMEENFIDDVALKSHISTLKDQKNTLQRLVKHTEDERKLCLSENFKLREQCSALEAEILELGRSQRARQLAPSLPQTFLEVAPTPIANPPRMTAAGNSARPVKAGQGLLRVPAQSVAFPHTTRTEESGRSSKWGSSPETTPFPGRGGPSVPPLLDVRALGRIQVRHPTPQKRALLERIELYEAHLATMQASEADRQDAFNEMERSRAELFTFMNEQLVRQRAEIQSLYTERLQLREALNSSQGGSDKVKEDDLSTEASPNSVVLPRALYDAETETDGSPFNLARHEQKNIDSTSANMNGKHLIDETTSLTFNEIYKNMFRDLLYLEEKGRNEILLCWAETRLEDLVSWFQLWGPFCVLYSHNRVFEDRKMVTKESLVAQEQEDGISFLEEKARTTNPGFSINYTQELLSKSNDEDKDGAPSELNPKQTLLFDFEKENYSKFYSALDILLILYGNALSEYNELAKACLDEATSMYSFRVGNDDDTVCNETDMHLVRDVFAEIEKHSVKKETITPTHELDLLGALFDGPLPSFHNTDTNIDITHFLPHSEFKEGCDKEPVIPSNNQIFLNLGDLPVEEVSGNPSMNERGISAGSRSSNRSVEERGEVSPLRVNKSPFEEHDSATHTVKTNSTVSTVITPRNDGDLILQPLKVITAIASQQESTMKNEYDSICAKSNSSCKSEANEKDNTQDFVDAQEDGNSNSVSQVIFTSSSSPMNLQVHFCDEAFHTPLSTVSPVEEETIPVSQRLRYSYPNTPLQEGSPNEIQTGMEGSNSGADYLTTSEKTNQGLLQNSSLYTVLDSDSNVDKAAPQKATILVKEEKTPPQSYAVTLVRKGEFTETSSCSSNDTDNANFKAEFNPFA